MSDKRDAFTKWWDAKNGDYRGSGLHKALARMGWEARDAEIANLNRQGYILAMRVLQSDLVLDDAEMAARDAFLTETNIRATLSYGEPKEGGSK